MKKLTIILILLLSVNLSAQSWFKESVKGNGELRSSTRDVGEYDKITVAGSFNIVLVKGKEGNLDISVESNLEKYLVTKVKNGKLVIRWDNNFKVRPKKSVHIVVTFKSFDELVLAGSGDIEAKDEINADDFDIKLAGSGNIKLLLSSKDVDCTMAGSGNVTLIGDSTDLDCSKAGSGDFYGYDFKCENIDIDEAGSGDAKVYVTNVLDAKTAGSGNIFYKGSPKENNAKVAGSGSIIMK